LIEPPHRGERNARIVNWCFSVAEKVNVTLPVAGKTSPQVDQQSTENETTKDTIKNDTTGVLPAVNPCTDDKSTHDGNAKGSENKYETEWLRVKKYYITKSSLAFLCLGKEVCGDICKCNEICFVELGIDVSWTLVGRCIKIM